ncbi:MAG: hypothetical protein JWR62_1947, partial [Modestobacter sp.]|nr:hypothetical protein [Modestobacter sp.]
MLSSGGARSVDTGARLPHQVGRRWPGGRIGSGSGRRSPRRGWRPRRRAWRGICPSVPASSVVTSPSTATMSAVRCGAVQRCLPDGTKVVHSRLGDVPFGDQAAAVPHRAGQGHRPDRPRSGKALVELVDPDPGGPPVASTADTGSVPSRWSRTGRCRASRPGRSTGRDTGSTAIPAALELIQTRLLTVPGSIVMTSVDAGNASAVVPRQPPASCGNVTETLPRRARQRLSAVRACCGIRRSSSFPPSLSSPGWSGSGAAGTARRPGTTHQLPRPRGPVQQRRRRHRE